jgi:hypothetical protein
MEKPKLTRKQQDAFIAGVERQLGHVVTDGGGNGMANARVSIKGGRVIEMKFGHEVSTRDLEESA